MIDIVELTKMLGLADDQQSAVMSWTGEVYGTTWTDGEAAELVDAWHADHSGEELAR